MARIVPHVRGYCRRSTDGDRAGAGEASQRPPLPVRLDADLDGEGLAGAADEDRAGGRGGVEAVAADRGADVVGLGQDAVGGVEALPAELGEVELDPGVGGLALALVGQELGGLGAGVNV